MSNVIETVRAALRSRPAAGERILAAVSGGADSVALLRALEIVSSEVGCSVAAVHVDHRLRGQESDDDAAWVASLCESRGIEFRLERSDVRAIAASRGTGLEEAARSERMAVLNKVAREVGARFVAVGHTADDQAETVLHHVLRGTGLSGLRGIPSERRLDDGVTLIRPLLNLRRDDIVAWLAEIGQDFRIDSTNRDFAFTRNRLRHELIPHLCEAYNPQVVESLLRLARQAAEAEEALRRIAMETLDRAMLPEDSPAIVSFRERCRLEAAVLAAQPRHIVRQCFVELWSRRRWPRQAMTADHWDRLASLATSRETDAPAAMTLPGRIDARRIGDAVCLTADPQGRSSTSNAPSRRGAATSPLNPRGLRRHAGD